MWRNLKESRGLTLLEVVVALACVSLTLFSFISLVISSTQIENYAKGLTMATLLADRLIKEIESRGFPEPGDEEGEIENETGFYYRRHVSETFIEGIREVTLEILWDEGKHRTEFVFYVRRK